MTEWIITAVAPNGEDREKTLNGDEDDAKAKVSELEGLGFTAVRYAPAPEQSTSDGGVEVVNQDPEPVEPDVVEAEELSKNPIDFLQSINSDFVNHIRGKPAISKQGFRFIQREFEITTESEVVQWIDDPLGCVAWAKAELPNGYSAEAHGEGYQFESDVSDNEFVRYADTRAKNRAISDLTSAGALAVSELTDEG